MKASEHPSEAPGAVVGSMALERTFLVDVDADGVCAGLYLLDGRFGVSGGYRLGRGGWVDDELPYSWFAGGANHLDPVNRRWALRHADDLGVDEATFEAPGSSGG
ncbi:MAG: hypothetical protein QGI28_04500 [Acidimicrobiales bacterium]|nr:hypothetical protein [Acidimicrobiales bacterium]